MSEDRKREHEEPNGVSSAADSGRIQADELSRNDRFREFFTTSVIEVPEEMRKVDRETDSVEEPPEPRRGFAGWLRGLFVREEEDEEDASDVLIPGRAAAAQASSEAEETGEIPLRPDEREPSAEAAEETGEVLLQPDEEESPAEAAEETGEIPLRPAPAESRLPERKKAGEAPPAPEPAAVQSHSAAEEKAPAAQATAAAPVTVPAKPARAVPAVTIGQLLEKIDETQAELRPGERAQKPAAEKTAPAAGAASAAAETPQPAGPVGTAPEMPPEPAPEEPAAAPKAPASAQETADAGAMPAATAQAAQQTAAALERELAETLRAAMPAVSLAPQENELADRAAPSAVQPEQEAAPAVQAAQPEERMPENSPEPNGEEEEPTREVVLPGREHAAREAARAAEEEPTREVPGEDEPTGEVSLARAEEPTGEISLSEADAGEASARGVSPAEEPTGEIALTEGEAPAAEAAGEAGPRAAAGSTLVSAFAEASGRIDLPEDADEENRAWELPPRPSLRDLLQKAAAFVRGDNSEEEPVDSGEKPAEIPALPEEEEYTDPENAEAVRGRLAHSTALLTLRCALTGVLAAALLVLGLLGQGPAPVAVLDPAVDPTLWLGLNFVLLALCLGLNWTVLRDGLPAMLPRHTPSAAALPAVTALGALLQTALCILMRKNASVPAVTLFAAAAALLLFADVLGRRLAAGAVRDGFAQMTSGVETATAYRLQDARLTKDLCAGMDEEEPVLMLSRPASLLKNFLGQSAAPHRSDAQAVDFARVLSAVAVLCMLISLVMRHDIIRSVSLLAGILCLGAPLSAMLVRAVPALLMQRAAGRVGAVIPGWPGIEQMGDVDMLQVDASELFPPACAFLYGIKTIQKERIDRAILYATSILIEGCSTLSGLFRNMIENNDALLYPVKDLEKRPGEGFVAWCDSCRVLLGTRAMMEAEGIALPALDYENRYTQNGDRQLLYLAVSGKLSAMFLFGYRGTKKVAHTLGVLRRENIRLLVCTDDPTLTAARIEEIYRLRPGFIKVLNGAECAQLAPATAYLPATDGCMVHLPDFTSVVGGLRAAASAERAERSACTVQMVAVVVSVLLSLLFTLSNSLYDTPMLYPLLYQIAWSAICIAITLTKMY